MKIINCEQGSYEWHVERHGRITGTDVASALGTPVAQKTLLVKTVAELMTEVQIREFNSAAVDRGKESEPLARAAAAEHLGAEFTEVGMLVSEEIDLFGISPDGVVYDGDKVVGGIEIKCPDSKNHVRYLLDDCVPKDYIGQIKAPFLVSPWIDFWYFVSFDDRNYERPLFVKKLTRTGYEAIDTFSKTTTSLGEDMEKLDNFVAEVKAAHLDLTF